MVRRHVALALLVALQIPAANAADKAPARSPLGIYPAEVEYLSNDSPFVLFDVSPRVVKAGADATVPLSLTYLATDNLLRMTVVAYTSQSKLGGMAVASRTECGAKVAGYYSCTIPTQQALFALDGAEGLIALRVEAEGLDGDHSTVQVTLPVRHRPPRIKGGSRAP